MGFPRESDHLLPLHRPDVLPLRGPTQADARDVVEGPSDDPRIEHLRRVSLFSDCTDDELRRIAQVSRTVEIPAGTTAYLCGPVPFLRSVRGQLIAAGVRPADIHYEVFGPDLWLGADA